MKMVDCSIGTLSLYLWTIAVCIAFSIPICFMYWLLDFQLEAIISFLRSSFFIFLVSIVILCGLHELLHAFGFVVFARAKLSEIRFAFVLKYLAPSAGTTKLLTPVSYLWSALLPAIVLGFIPLSASILLKQEILYFYSFLMILTAAGDFIIASRLLKWMKKPEVLISDQGRKIGFEVMTPDNVA